MERRLKAQRQTSEMETDFQTERDAETQRWESNQDRDSARSGTGAMERHSGDKWGRTASGRSDSEPGHLPMTQEDLGMGAGMRCCPSHQQNVSPSSGLGTG